MTITSTTIFHLGAGGCSPTRTAAIGDPTNPALHVHLGDDPEVTVIGTFAEIRSWLADIREELELVELELRNGKRLVKDFPFSPSTEAAARLDAVEERASCA